MRTTKTLLVIVAAFLLGLFAGNVLVSNQQEVMEECPCDLCVGDV
jgi:disulfide bond formation protein DsbB